MSFQQIKPRRRKLYKGTILNTNGFKDRRYFQDFEVSGAIVVPVQWNGKVAQLHFWNFNSKVPVNEDASALIQHPGFCIRGPAIVVTGIEEWFCWSLHGDVDNVRDMFSHLDFKGGYRVLPSSRWTDRSNFYNDNEEDFVLIKLAI